MTGSQLLAAGRAVAEGPQPDDRQATVSGRVAEQARRRPQAPALRYRGADVTYRELDEAANRLAHELRARGVGPGSTVPVRLPRQPSLVAGLLAVLRAGAAYAAIPPDWPPARVAAVVAGCGSPVMLTDAADNAAAGTDLGWSGTGGRPGPDRVVPVPVPRRLADLAANRPASAPEVRVGPDDPACVFFTSGSTGEPKGAVSPHRATVRLFSPAPFARFDATTVTLGAAPVPWDAFSLELWGALLTGGCCVLPADAPVTAAGLRAAVRDGVNTVWLTSSLLNLLVDEDLGCFTGLRQVLTGGERVSPEHVRLLLAAYPSLHVVNGYGPVESTVFVTTATLGPDCPGPGDTEVPIGTPVPGTTVLVTRPDGTAAATGEVGEIHLAGTGLALGYLGAPDLTAAAFRTDLPAAPGTPTYRTGDLGVLDERGVLWFRGRADRQVKIRGVRVEPAETEAVLRRHPAVRSAAVVPLREEGGPVTGLAAWLTGPAGTSDAPAPSDPAEAPGSEAVAAVREYARRELPERLVPAHLRFVPELPRTDSGKIDYRRLERWAADLARTAPAPAAGRAPATPSEALVADLVADLLGLPAVSADTDLLAAGGDSLAAIRLVHRLAARTNQTIDVGDVLAAGRVDQIAARLDAARRAAVPGGPAGGAGAHPLSYGQARLWWAEQLDPGDPAYLVYRWAELTGPLDLAALRAAAADVQAEHPVLRTVYADRGGVPEQRVLPAGDPPPVRELTVDPADHEPARQRAAAEPVDLATGPVWGLTVLRDRTGRVTVLLRVHHVAVDGASLPVLFADLATAYAARAAGQVPVLPAANRRLTAWSAGQRARSERRIEANAGYWRRSLRGRPDLALPRPDPEPSRAPMDRTGAHPPRVLPLQVLPLSVEPAALRAVRAGAARAGVSPGVALLGLYARALADLTGQADLGLAVPLTERASPELDRMVAFCVETVPVRLDLCAHPSRPDTAVGDWLEQLYRLARQAFRDAVTHRMPFDAIVSAVGPPRTGRPPLAQACFVAQTHPDPVLRLPPVPSTPGPTPPSGGMFELTWELWPRPDAGAGLDGSIQYQPAAVSAAAAHQLRAHLHRLLALAAATAGPQPAAEPTADPRSTAP